MENFDNYYKKVSIILRVAISGLDEDNVIVVKCINGTFGIQLIELGKYYIIMENTVNCVYKKNKDGEIDEEFTEDEVIDFCTQIYSIFLFNLTDVKKYNFQIY
jgi:hypothetical protein